MELVKIETAKKQFLDQLENCPCPFDAWDSKTAKFALRLEYTDWLLTLAEWTTFLTLTFREPIAYDSAINKFRYLIQVLNKELFGSHYTRIVRHSYFSYICAAEYQIRDVLHFHVVIDRPVDKLLIHNLWNKWAGFAQTKKIENSYSAVSYAIKYAIKESDINIYQADYLYKPKQYPIRWKYRPEETF